MSTRGMLAVSRQQKPGQRTVHRSHDESDLGGIGSAGKVGVYLLGLVLVQGYESVQDIIASRGIVGSTFFKIRFVVIPSVGSILVELAFIVREIVLHRADG